MVYGVEAVWATFHRPIDHRLVKENFDAYSCLGAIVDAPKPKEVTKIRKKKALVKR